MTQVSGIVLAAGAGTRAGGAKALRLRDDGEPWVRLTVSVLRDAGCDPIVVVLGAEADAARAFVPEGVAAVVADDWADGLSASVRAGLAAASGEAALITLVDLPGMPAGVARAVLGEHPRPASLRRAVYGGRPGHPVLIGRDHWDAVAATATGDTGAGAYLREHEAELIECGSLFDGEDVDV